MPAPTVTSISPSSGPLGGGIAVTITGTNFTGTTGVSIGGTSVGSFTIASGTSITCNTPAGSAGTASVLVTNASGTNAANTLYTYMAVPTVTGISPSTGSYNGGTSVTITGTNFIGATGVMIGGMVPTSVSVVNSTTITCTTHSNSAGAASVVVTTPGGANGSNSLFTYIGPPVVSSVSPAGGPVTGGTAVTITGNYLAGTTAVTIGGTAATGITAVSSTSVTCTIPAHAAGTAGVRVTTPEGTSADNSLFTFMAVPTVTSISPTSGTSAGGTLVTITGTNLTNVTGVSFRGVAATSFSVVSDTKITCSAPEVSPGTASVLVTNLGGSNPSNSLFTYMPPAPTVTSTAAYGVTPGVGSALGGTPVTITGTDFIGAGSVTIGGVPATNVVVVNSTTLTCISPPGSVETVSVVVTTPSGTNADNNLFSYASKKPEVNLSTTEVPSVVPPRGTAAGGTSVTISGKYFTGTSGVTFNGVAATRVVVVNDSTITCLTPAGSAEGAAKRVVVTTPSGTNESEDPYNNDNRLFTYVQSLPTVTGVSPPIGTAAGGTSVTITGTYFTQDSLVTFGGVAVTDFTFVNASTINCTTPAGIAGSASVLVTAEAGTSASNSLYLYVQGTATDTYIYLKGGRGDGFVPQWTGALSEEGVVSESGAPLGTAGREVAEPYRDIFPSSSVDQNFATYQFFYSQIPYLKDGTARGFYPEEGGVAANTGKGRLSDEVAHVRPRQFTRVSTWMIFTSANGLPYKYRKELVLGWGSKPRAE